MANKDHILEPDEEGEMRKIYNFQTNNLHGGYREIRGHLQQIFNDQENPFQINFAFGIILFNNDTGEYRYYIPHFNSRMLTYPFISMFLKLTSHWDIQMTCLLMLGE